MCSAYVIVFSVTYLYRFACLQLTLAENKGREISREKFRRKYVQFIRRYRCNKCKKKKLQNNNTVLDSIYSSVFFFFFFTTYTNVWEHDCLVYLSNEKKKITYSSVANITQGARSQKTLLPTESPANPRKIKHPLRIVLNKPNYNRQ